MMLIRLTWAARSRAVQARDTEELILKCNPSWTTAGSTGVYPERVDELMRGGFRLVEEFCYHHDKVYSHVRWRRRMRTCNGVGSGGLPPAEVQQFDEERAPAAGPRISRSNGRRASRVVCRGQEPVVT